MTKESGLSQIKKQYAEQRSELDRITKILLKRDFALTEATAQLTEERNKLKRSRMATLHILEDVNSNRKALSAEKNKVEAIINNLVDGLIMVDKNKRVVLINPKAGKFLGIKEKEMLGKTLLELRRVPLIKKLSQLLGKEIKFKEEEYELFLEKPTEKFFQVVIVGVSVEKEQAGTMIVLHDITREKTLERLKTEFISIAAHQLRTPLSSVKWILKMMVDGDLGTLLLEQKEFVRKAYEANEKMIRLVNDLLDISRIEEGKFGFNFSKYDFNKFMKEVVASFKEQAERGKVKLKLKIGKSALPLVFDQQRIKMSLSNLLDNAIRYTMPQGEITVSVAEKEDFAEVSIKDTGVGIPEEQKDRIFSKFFRADNVVRMQTEGTGLGLYLCKNIIEKHGGKIWFESKEGKGTSFYFTLPKKHSH
jgi:PAS domain S-box-containing protein